MLRQRHGMMREFGDLGFAGGSLPFRSFHVELPLNPMGLSWLDLDEEMCWEDVGWV